MEVNINAKATTMLINIRELKEPSARITERMIMKDPGK